MTGRFSKIKWGDGLTVTDEGQGVIRVDGGGGSAGTGGHTIQDEGTALPAQPALNFTGAGVTATDDPANGRTLVTIPGGGGTPPDATTSSKGVVQLAGDLAGTAASPQIAPGVIVNADVAAAAAIGVTKLAPGTNGQVLTTVSGAPAWAAAPAAPTVGYGTTLPASPVDGQEAILVDSTTNPSRQWRFRYNAGSSSFAKWEFVGGSDVCVETPGSDNTSAGSTANLTNGPTFTIPRDGDYMLEIDSIASNTAADGVNQLNVGDQAVAANELLNRTFGQTATAGRWSTIHLKGRANGVAAGTVLAMKAWVAGGGTGTYQARRLSVQPIRVA